MSAQPFDFTAAESGFVAWLKENTQAAVPGPLQWARKVSTAKDLTAITEEMQVVPGVYVVYDGFATKAADEYSATLVHRWLIVLAIGTAASQRDAAPLNDMAGPWLFQLFTGLHGLTLPGCTSPLVPATPPRPYFSPAKFAYYPLAFTHESVSCSTPRRFQPAN